ncbi:hypothetical protein BDN70DRAFT_926724 [Pholiota conissans]|uniref:Uncharacterized protein n=1 Tax=Pholiota conissans TaxID=109636 RepID=A0A9P5ZFH3_9AGAR|nr:hypothetical protein BDN70DRAFT_926724 [Pholiota conissans]
MGNFRDHFSRPAERGWAIFLLIITCIASFFLFLSAFGAPFIPSIYLVRVDFKFAPSTKTVRAVLGPFGFCRQFAQNSNHVCSQPRIGYQLDDASFYKEKGFPTLPSLVVNALVIQLITFALSLTTVIFLLLSTFRYKPAAMYAFKVHTSYNMEASLQLGNAVWFTLTSFLMQTFAICYDFSIRRRRRGPYVENISAKNDDEQNPQSDNEDDIILLRRFLHDVLEQPSTQAFAPHRSQIPSRPISKYLVEDRLKSRPLVSSARRVISNNANHSMDSVRFLSMQSPSSKTVPGILINSFPGIRPMTPLPDNGTVHAPTIRTLSPVSTFRINSISFADVWQDAVSLPPTPPTTNVFHHQRPQEMNRKDTLRVLHTLQTSPSSSTLNSIISKFPMDPSECVESQRGSDVSCSRSDDSEVALEGSGLGLDVACISGR